MSFNLIIFPHIYAEVMYKQVPIWERQEYIKSDALFFSLHLIRKHMMPICSITEYTIITWLTWSLTCFSAVKLIRI